MLRHPGTPESIGRGVATGFFTAFFIPFGIQMPAALALTFPMRAARLVALLSTWLSNPFTIPFLYPLQCYVGGCILRRPSSYPEVKHMLSGIISDPSLKSLATLGAELLTAFLVGGLLFGTVAALAGYYTTVPLVKRHRVIKMQRHQARAIRRMNHETQALNLQPLEKL